MKKLKALTFLSICAVWSATAQDADGRKGLSEQETADRNALVAKHDLDGDGVLSKSELKGLSKEEKKTLARTGGVGTAKKGSRQTEVKAEKQPTRTEADKGSKKEKSAPASRPPAAKDSKGGKGKGGKK